MNPLSDTVWQAGSPYARYRGAVHSHDDVFDDVYRNPAFTADDLELLRTLPALNVLAIGEDWCPDVYHTLPTWARVAEELDGWELRVFARDSHAEVMDHFLWLGSARRVPVYAFYDSRGYLQTWWSGRSGAAQRAVDTALAGRSFGELDPEEKSRVGHLLDDGYRREFRRANFVEILAQLEAFYHR